MNKELKRFMNTEFKSKARIVDSKMVEVTAPDGEVFQVLCQVGAYLSEETRKYELHLIEAIFDKNFSEDKELMTNNIWRESFARGVAFLGISSGDRQRERIRIGGRIRQIREERNMEAKLAGIDAANLSRIENGKYSVGIDILSRIAAVLGKKIDFIDL
jgi:DNA-binding XRE family transcriptional regulator